MRFSQHTDELARSVAATSPGSRLTASQRAGRAVPLSQEISNETMPLSPLFRVQQKDAQGDRRYEDSDQNGIRARESGEICRVEERRNGRLRFLSLFAGIGGFDLGLEGAGHRCVGQIEIDPFCRRVLRTHFASVEQQVDVRVAAFDDGGRGIDLLCGGFPCQDLSVAGKRAGLGGARSGLFWEIVRIAKITRPTWGLFENVPGLLSSRGGADMWTVIAGLRECWPVVGYRILDSQWFGVPQRRRRVFFVCGPTEAGVRAVLFEPEGGGGNPAAGDEAGTGVAASLRSGVGAPSNDPGRRREDDVNLVVGINGSGLRGRQPGSAASFVAHALSRPTSNGRLDPNGEDFVMQQCHGSNMGPMGALRGGNGHLTGGVPFVFEPKASAHQSMNPSTSAPALGTTKEPAVFGAVGVRRLTPLECERLQGFPDGWSCLCGTEDHELGCKCPDSPRYRAIGNAVTVNVIRWIAERF